MNWQPYPAFMICTGCTGLYPVSATMRCARLDVLEKVTFYHPTRPNFRAARLTMPFNRVALSVLQCSNLQSLNCDRAKGFLIKFQFV